ncbi:MAG: hypothetical protein IIA82_08140 [Thaumarchaeota archaeon]|nr:hypothetical protein [Nitrososphaerota archaeon]
MQKKIYGLILAGLILLLPIQNASAGWFDDDFIDTQKKIFDFSQKLPIIIQQFYYNTLDQTLLSEISVDLLELQKLNPEVYRTLSEWFPEIKDLILTNYLNERTRLLDSLETIEQSEYATYVSEIALQLQQIAIKEMSQLVYAQEISQFDSKEEIVVFASDELLNRFYTTDERTGEQITLKEHKDQFFEMNPELQWMDNPNEYWLKVVFESGYVFSIPIIQMEDGQLVSIDEFCELKMDEQKCNLIKDYAILAHMVIKKDPNAGLEIAKIVLNIAIDVNDRTDAGYDSELLFVQYFVNKTPEELLDEKAFRLNGELVSLNYLTSIQCDDTNVELAEKFIVGYNAKNKSIQQMESEYIELVHLLQNIDETSCSVPILK